VLQRSVKKRLVVAICSQRKIPKKSELNGKYTEILEPRFVNDFQLTLSKRFTYLFTSCLLLKNQEY